jgi:hypothetical protein
MPFHAAEVPLRVGRLAVHLNERRSDMTFDRLDTVVLTPRRQSPMLEEESGKTEIQTLVGDSWKHDAYDSDKPIS